MCNCVSGRRGPLWCSRCWSALELHAGKASGLSLIIRESVLPSFFGNHVPLCCFHASMQDVASCSPEEPGDGEADAPGEGEDDAPGEGEKDAPGEGEGELPAHT